MGVQYTKAITPMTIHKLGLSTATRAIARSSTGKAIITSVRRIMLVPRMPEK